MPGAAPDTGESEKETPDRAGLRAQKEKQATRSFTKCIAGSGTEARQNRTQVTNCQRPMIQSSAKMGLKTRVLFRSGGLHPTVHAFRHQPISCGRGSGTVTSSGIEWLSSCLFLLVSGLWCGVGSRGVVTETALGMCRPLSAGVEYRPEAELTSCLYAAFFARQSSSTRAAGGVAHFAGQMPTDLNVSLHRVIGEGSERAGRRESPKKRPETLWRLFSLVELAGRGLSGFG
jgi:hypothetical protein